MINRLRRGIAIIVCSVFANYAMAQTESKLPGASLPSTWAIGDTRLVLNGAGLRLYSFLKIPVYAAALYWKNSKLILRKFCFLLPLK
jgi:hypothetical protein